MGAERWLKLKSAKEAERLKDYLGDMTSMGVEGQYGWWFEWSGKKKIEIGYSMGMWSSEGAAIVCREIAKRFEIKRIGADSTGWYEDSDWESDGEHSSRALYGDFTSWADWMENYDLEWSMTYRMFQRHGDHWARELEGLRELEAFVVGEFEKLDAA